MDVMLSLLHDKKGPDWASWSDHNRCSGLPGGRISILEVRIAMATGGIWSITLINLIEIKKFCSPEKGCRWLQVTLNVFKVSPQGLRLSVTRNWIFQSWCILNSCQKDLHTDSWVRSEIQKYWKVRHLESDWLMGQGLPFICRQITPPSHYAFW